MALRIYNTLTRTKEAFEPVTPGKVRMYVCGPTVYDACHIGHARSVVVFDVIARYLRSLGFDVLYVRNFTDVDDKIINRARQLDQPWHAIAERYIREFHEDMDALHVQRADLEPRATEHIEQIIQVIQRLVDKNHAYEIQGDVFFAVDTFAEYGKLSGRKLDDMEAGARVDVDARKRNPFDFALWKAAKPGEPAWPSPWGEGRPGWHIECSAMSWQHLGETFDIHGGGKDLVFPHHENEIAQSEAAFARPFAKHWIHNGFVNINHEKMSKSLGNFLVIREVLKTCHPEAVRLFLLSNHYRSPVDFTDKALVEAGSGLEKLYALLLRMAEALRPAENLPPGELWQSFRAAMDDDFNTAKGIGLMFDAVRTANRLLDQSSLDATQKDQLQAIRADMNAIGGILGILNQDPAAYFEHLKSAGLAKQDADPAQIEALIAERAAARKAKDFARADEIRDQLGAMKVVIEDRPEGTLWKLKQD